MQEVRQKRNLCQERALQKNPRIPVQGLLRQEHWSVWGMQRMEILLADFLQHMKLHYCLRTRFPPTFFGFSFFSSRMPRRA